MRRFLFFSLVLFVFLTMLYWLMLLASSSVFFKLNRTDASPKGFFHLAPCAFPRPQTGDTCERTVSGCSWTFVFTACPTSALYNRRTARWVWRALSLRRTQPRASSSGYSSTLTSRQQVGLPPIKDVSPKIDGLGVFGTTCSSIFV